MMKNIFVSFLFLFAGFSTLLAQGQNDQRVLTTKVADVLARFPAQNKEQLTSNIKSLSDLGKSGYQELVNMLSAPGKGNNTALEYAINAWSVHVMEPGNEKLRQQAVDVYCTSLRNPSLEATRAFLIRQLQLTGKDEAVSCLQPFLNNDSLAGYAARALAQIGSAAAERTLLQSLLTASKNNIVTITEALGYSRYKPAVSKITPLVRSTDKELRKIALYSLARIADPASARVLQEEAARVKYNFTNTGETSAYFLYLEELSKTNKAVAARMVAQLMQHTETAGKVHPRIAALKLFVEVNGNKSLPVLYQSMLDSSIEYRGAALKYSIPYQSSITNRQFLSTLPSVKPDVQAQIIQHLGRTGDKNIVTPLEGYLKVEDKQVRLAAIDAVARLGQESSVSPLLNIMNTGSAEEIQAARNALLLISSGDIGSIIAPRLNSMPPAAKVALIEVLAARASVNSFEQVYSQINNADTSVHRAAVKALPSIVAKKDLPQLYSLVNLSKPADVPYYQQAVIAASAGITDTVERSSEIISKMKAAPSDKQHIYLGVLGGIGGKTAFDAIENSYNTGNAEMKAAAVSALSRNYSSRSAALLLDIARKTGNSGASAALDGYIDVISRAAFTADQKILMLKEAMALSKNEAQKKRILREASRNQTFQSLVFAGKYLDDATLQQDAANAVMNICLSHKEYYGKTVRDLMTKTLAVKKGADSDYQKEAIRKHLADMPSGDGYVSLFNGKDLSGWKGLVADPVKRASMDAATLAREQKKADSVMKKGWQVQDGLLVFTGHGDNLVTDKQYGDFEMLVDWKITKDGDAGIYLRGTPQVQIWDTARRDVGAEVGSGGLYNNEKNISKPLVVADNAVGEWNTFRIIMKGDKVTVFLNGQLVTDNVPLENFWDRNKSIFPKEQIELQAHGTYVAYRDIFIHELYNNQPYQLNEEEKKEGYKVLFDGTNLDQWTGNKSAYVVENGELVVKPGNGSGGNLFTKDEYADFVFRFEFQLTPGANNGLGIRAPLTGDAAYEGMELQILDNDADIYKNLKEYQYHGSVYGVIPAKRGFLKPMGEWNYEEVIVKGTKVKVILNGEVILDGDIAEASRNGTLDEREHPGLKKAKGHIGFLGHGSQVKFRNIRIKEIK